MFYFRLLSENTSCCDVEGGLVSTTVAAGMGTCVRAHQDGAACLDRPCLINDEPMIDYRPPPSTNITSSFFCLWTYHWGQNEHLPNFYSRRIILGNCMSSMCTKEKVLGEFISKNLAKITLYPKSAPNLLGNVFVPNGNFVGVFRKSVYRYRK